MSKDESSACRLLEAACTALVRRLDDAALLLVSIEGHTALAVVAVGVLVRVPTHRRGGGEARWHGRRGGRWRRGQRQRVLVERALAQQRVDVVRDRGALRDSLGQVVVVAGELLHKRVTPSAIDMIDAVPRDAKVRP